MKNKIRVAVIGSRGFKNYEAMVEELKKLPVDVIVSGGAKGADSLAEKYATVANIETLIFPADWKKYGKRAGFVRNKDIIDNCDYVVAFWDGSSSGTLNSLQYAKSTNKPIFLYLFDVMNQSLVKTSF